MMNGADRVEFPNVEILAENQHILLCRVNGKLVTIASRRLLPGTTVGRRGDHGALVLSRELAHTLGLV